MSMDTIARLIADGNRSRQSSETERPSLICCKTVIGFGAPNKQGTAATHGAPLGDDEIAAARARNSVGNSPPFEFPGEIARLPGTVRLRGAADEQAWQKTYVR